MIDQLFLSRVSFFPPGQYVVSFRPDPGAPSVLVRPGSPTVYRPLTLEERAVRIGISPRMCGSDFFNYRISLIACWPVLVIDRTRTLNYIGHRLLLETF